MELEVGTAGAHPFWHLMSLCPSSPLQSLGSSPVS